MAARRRGGAVAWWRWGAPSPTPSVWRWGQLRGVKNRLGMGGLGLDRRLVRDELVEQGRCLIRGALVDMRRGATHISQPHAAIAALARAHPSTTVFMESGASDGL